MIKVEICKVTHPYMAMPHKAEFTNKRFKMWAKKFDLEYNETDSMRMIEFDEKNFVIFTLTYPYEYRVVDGL